MQPNASSVYTSNIIWIIGLNKGPSSSQFQFESCQIGALLSSSPCAIVFEPDQYEMGFCIDQIKFYKERLPSIPIIIYSSWSDAVSVFPLVKAGIDGYLLKGSGPDLDETIQSVISGGAPFAPEISAILLSSTRNYLPSEASDFNLGTTEIEMLQLMSEGLTKKEISLKYDRSIHTIDNHVRKIYLKMGVNNLGAAIGHAFRAGLIY